MATFPKIQSPCPFKGPLSAIMDGDTCRLCDRKVFDITDLTNEQRAGFFAGCAEEVCVSYKFPIRPAVAAAITAAIFGAPMAASAQQVSPREEVIIVGGIKDPANVEYVANPRDGAVPEAPVVYEDEPVATTDASAPAADASAPTAAHLGDSVETQ